MSRAERVASLAWPSSEFYIIAFCQILVRRIIGKVRRKDSLLNLKGHIPITPFLRSWLGSGTV
jgi:hypothetical protein